MSAVDDLRTEAQELSQKLASPELLSRPDLLRDLSRKLKEVQKEVAGYEERETLLKRKKEAERILAESHDSDLRILAQQELLDIESQQRLSKSGAQKKQRLILEIRPGTGGDEAALFAYALTRMYLQFAQKEHWDVAVLDESLTELGGVKAITLAVAGPGASSLLSSEAGVHRVQRIPSTEKSGRIHTSTVTVAVLPEPEEKEMEIRPQDLRVDTMRASGPGGQFVNRRESAIRITHIPSGIVVGSQTARTQLANREQSMKMLRAKLAAREAERQAQARGSARRTQIGSGERAEKIRTYNFPQDRVTDHRIKKSWHNIAKIMDGEIGPILQPLQDRISPKS